MSIEDSTEARVSRLANFDVANLLVDARNAIHDAAGQGRQGAAERMLDRWEDILPGLSTLAAIGRRLQASGSLPPEAHSFGESQEFRETALRQLTHAVVEGRVDRIRRWRFAGLAYARKVKVFLQEWDRARSIEGEEERLKEAVSEISRLRNPLIAEELDARWSGQDPSVGIRLQRLERTKYLVRTIERRRERREEAANERDFLYEEVAEWIGGEPTSELSLPESPFDSVALLDRLRDERNLRRARRLARRIARDRRAALVVNGTGGEGRESPLRELSEVLASGTKN